MKVSMDHVHKTFMTLRGPVEALADIDLQIGAGEFFILLGPSGCGKSTTLNLVAGLENPSAGRILFDQRAVADAQNRNFLSPAERDVAMVFQSYALYPHMTVFGNIAFPLKIAGVEKAQIRGNVARTAAMLGIEPLLARKPGELSGGQRQRVAIARALVRDPKVFLLDEPLSNLDAQLRTAMRGELKRLQRETGITTLYVTHDQTEAMTLGDRIALFNKGRLVQIGTPQTLYDAPDNPFSASFIGSPPMNLLPAEIRQEGESLLLLCGEHKLPLPAEKMDRLKQLPGREVLLGLRPEDITLSASPPANGWSGTVLNIEPLGREWLLHIRSGPCLVVVLSTEKKAQIGQPVHMTFNPAGIHLFDPDAESHKRAVIQAAP